MIGVRYLIARKMRLAICIDIAKDLDTCHLLYYRQWFVIFDSLFNKQHPFH